MTTTTDLTRRFADEIIPDDLPNETLEPGRIIWLHGTKQGGAKTPGVFYVKASELSDTPSAPWKADDERFENEYGYSTPELKIAIIGFRSQWFIPAAEPGQPPEWLQEYREGVGAKKSTEYLCLVEGIADPMVLSVSGKNKAGPLLDILKTYQNGLLKQASRIKRRQMPLWSFWLPIANRRDEGGQTLYLTAQDSTGKVYKSIVTPPALYLPDNPLDTLYVGAETISYGAQVRNDFAEWFKAKRLPQGTVEGHVTVSAPKQLAAPRNVPQPLHPDEYNADDEEVF